eukprot:scaffold4081_cov268-Pinguiococcus_pyrenoidosus.AAC.4
MVHLCGLATRMSRRAPLRVAGPPERPEASRGSSGSSGSSRLLSDCVASGSARAFCAARELFAPMRHSSDSEWARRTGGYRLLERMARGSSFSPVRSAFGSRTDLDRYWTRKTFTPTPTIHEFFGVVSCESGRASCLMARWYLGGPEPRDVHRGALKVSGLGEASSRAPMTQTQGGPDCVPKGGEAWGRTVAIKCKQHFILTNASITRPEIRRLIHSTDKLFTEPHTTLAFANTECHT